MGGRWDGFTVARIATMITRIVGYILERSVGSQKFGYIAKAAGRLVNVDGITLNHDEADPLVQSTLRACEEQGLSLWGNRDEGSAKPSARLSLQRLRDYAAEDLRGCDFIELVPIRLLVDCDLRRPFDGILSGFQQTFPRNVPLAASFHDRDRLVVPSTTREAIDAQGFAGVTYRPIRLVKKRDKESHDTSDVVEIPWGQRAPWWELTSSVTMPIVAAEVIAAWNAKVLPRGCTTSPVYFRDPDYDDAELKFYESEVRAMPKFDIALTTERSKSEFAHFNICSQRMYQFGVAQGWECRWRPVRLIAGP
ncbi:MAG: hypothetical protein JSR77_18775 [Planctomycetes bacterium]|nr:hypothetical protein [Planctomycetota bacterium]